MTYICYAPPMAAVICCLSAKILACLSGGNCEICAGVNDITCWTRVGSNPAIPMGGGGGACCGGGAPYTGGGGGGTVAHIRALGSEAAARGSEGTAAIRALGSLGSRTGGATVGMAGATGGMGPVTMGAAPNTLVYGVLTISN